jgi:hypothetical protein
MNYHKKYLKYKRKYILLKNNQIGGREVDDIDKIIKLYDSIPESGLYDKTLSEEKRLEKFKTYCDFLHDKTKNNEDILQLKRKILLERKKLTDTPEYRELVSKINSRGDDYRKIGDDFEKKVFIDLVPIVTKELGLEDSQVELLKNPVLYLRNEDDTWATIGEIDSVIIQKRKGIKYIIAICEFKQNFDDIPDALFQIKRSYDAIKRKGEDNVKLNDVVLDKTYKLPENSDYLNISFIFTSFSDITYYNIQSKLRHYLINAIHLYGKIKYKKIFDKLLKKQINNDKLSGKKVLRYAKDVISTINILQKKELIKRLQII